MAGSAYAPLALTPKSRGEALEWKTYGELFDYCRGAHRRLLLECEHRLILLYGVISFCASPGDIFRSTYVERCELGAILVEGLVVEVGELL